MQPFDREYATREYFFGRGPHHDVAHFIEKYNVPTDGKALDLGCGDGKNTFYLAEIGFDVTAVDQSPVGIAKIAAKANANKLAINAIATSAADFEFVPNTYQFVLSYTMLDHVEPEMSFQLITEIKASLKPGGYVFIAVFNTDDPARVGASHSETGHYIKHFFEKGELYERFKDFRILKYQDEIHLDEAHGVAHYHGMSRVMAQKPR